MKGLVVVGGLGPTPLAPLNLALNWLLNVKAIASQSWDILGHSVPES